MTNTRHALLLAGAAMVSTMLPQVGFAAPVTPTLAAQYFQVAANTDADFPGGYPNVAMNSHLGPNGLPVGTGVSDLNAASEITWWSPVFNQNVSATGTGTITLPYSSSMFAPNSTGTNDNNYFETATFAGAFNLNTASTVQFSLGSDDDSFIYVDGQLFGQNPGIHATSNVVFTTPTLAAGAHTLNIFYADRQHVDATFSLNLLSSGVTITPPGVPEPATWAMMVLGFGAIGAMLRGQRRGWLCQTTAV